VRFLLWQYRDNEILLAATPMMDPILERPALSQEYLVFLVRLLATSPNYKTRSSYYRSLMRILERRLQLNSETVSKAQYASWSHAQEMLSVLLEEGTKLEQREMDLDAREASELQTVQKLGLVKHYPLQQRYFGYRQEQRRWEESFFATREQPVLRELQQLTLIVAPIAEGKP
jgi:hypothetical protein